MLQVDAPTYNIGTPIRAQHLNSIVGSVKALVKSMPANSLIDSTGIHTPRPRHIPSASGFFKLTNVSANPMTGDTQTCDNGGFSALGATGVSIYAHPQLDETDYAVDDYVFAHYIGNCWVAISIAQGGKVYTGGNGIAISGENAISVDIDTDQFQFDTGKLQTKLDEC